MGANHETGKTEGSGTKAERKKLIGNHGEKRKAIQQPECSCAGCAGRFKAFLFCRTAAVF
jgi:hypothetical protein